MPDDGERGSGTGEWGREVGDQPRKHTVGGDGPDAAFMLGTTTISALLGELAAIFAARPPGDPGKEAREVIAALYDVPRFWPVVNGHTVVSAEVRARAVDAALKRTRGAPLAYAVERASFRHLTLHVNESVLIPRPETELLVEIVIERVGPERGGIAIDVGTGSGAIALALATEGPFETVYGTDISLDALAVAGRNAESLASPAHARVELRHGALLAPVAGLTARAVVSNPPYIAYPEAASLPASVRDWEPAVALFSGADGLTATVKLIAEAAGVLEPGGLLAIEVDARRASLVVEAISGNGRYRDIGVRLDLAGRERFVIAHRTETE